MPAATTAAGWSGLRDAWPSLPPPGDSGTGGTAERRGRRALRRKPLNVPPFSVTLPPQCVRLKPPLPLALQIRANNSQQAPHVLQPWRLASPSREDAVRTVSSDGRGRARPAGWGSRTCCRAQVQCNCQPHSTTRPPASAGSTSARPRARARQPHSCACASASSCSARAPCETFEGCSGRERSEASLHGEGA